MKALTAAFAFLFVLGVAFGAKMEPPGAEIGRATNPVFRSYPYVNTECAAVRDPGAENFEVGGKVTLAALREMKDNVETIVLDKAAAHGPVNLGNSTTLRTEMFNPSANDDAYIERMKSWFHVLGWSMEAAAPANAEGHIGSLAFVGLLDGVRQRALAGGSLRLLLKGRGQNTFSVPHMDRNAFSEYTSWKDRGYIMRLWSGDTLRVAGTIPEDLLPDYIQETGFHNQCFVSTLSGPGVLATDMGDWGMAAALSMAKEPGVVLTSAEFGTLGKAQQEYFPIANEYYVRIADLPRMMRNLGLAVASIQSLAVPQVSNALGPEFFPAFTTEFRKLVLDVSTGFDTDFASPTFGLFNWKEFGGDIQKGMSFIASEPSYLESPKYYNGNEWVNECKPAGSNCTWESALHDLYDIRITQLGGRMQKQREQRETERTHSGGLVTFLGRDISELATAQLSQALKIRRFPNREKAQAWLDRASAGNVSKLNETFGELSGLPPLPTGVPSDHGGVEHVVLSKNAVMAARQSLMYGILASHLIMETFFKNFNRDPVQFNMVVVTIQHVTSFHARNSNLMAAVRYEPLVSGGKEIMLPASSVTVVGPVGSNHTQHGNVRLFKTLPVDGCSNFSPNMLSAFNWVFPFWIDNKNAPNEQVDFLKLQIGLRNGRQGSYAKKKGGQRGWVNSMGDRMEDGALVMDNMQKMSTPVTTCPFNAALASDYCSFIPGTEPSKQASPTDLSMAINLRNGTIHPLLMQGSRGLVPEEAYEQFLSKLTRTRPDVGPEHAHDDMYLRKAFSGREKPGKHYATHDSFMKRRDPGLRDQDVREYLGNDQCGFLNQGDIKTYRVRSKDVEMQFSVQMMTFTE